MSENPAPTEIISTRKSAGVTQTLAASLVHTTCRVWQQWEAGDRKMHPAFWELFTIKIKRIIKKKEIENGRAKK